MAENVIVRPLDRLEPWKGLKQVKSSGAML